MEKEMMKREREREWMKEDDERGKQTCRVEYYCLVVALCPILRRRVV